MRELGRNGVGQSSENKAGGGIRHPREQVFRGLCFSRQVVLQDRHEDGWK